MHTAKHSQGAGIEGRRTGELKDAGRAGGKSSAVVVSAHVNFAGHRSVAIEVTGGGERSHAKSATREWKGCSGLDGGISRNCGSAGDDHLALIHSQNPNEGGSPSERQNAVASLDDLKAVEIAGVVDGTGEHGGEVLLADDVGSGGCTAASLAAIEMSVHPAGERAKVNGDVTVAVVQGRGTGAEIEVGGRTAEVDIIGARGVRIETQHSGSGAECHGSGKIAHRSIDTEDTIHALKAQSGISDAGENVRGWVQDRRVAAEAGGNRTIGGNHERIGEKRRRVRQGKRSAC